jgi:predicted GIY-YIG superfamily endonuclease
MMQPAITQIPYIVYTLHFDRPVGRALHYTGICKEGRLHRRMLEHANGTGARLTARACAAGVGWLVVSQIRTYTAATETALKAAGHHNLRCPICTPKLRSTLPLAEFPRYEPSRPLTSWEKFGWPDAPPATPMPP